MYHNKEMRSMAAYAYGVQTAPFQESTNVYAPYYRQCNLTALMRANLPSEGFIEKLMYEPRSDTFAALDYYFTHYNNGRPFILASHSQGSSMLRIILAG